MIGGLAALVVLGDVAHPLVGEDQVLRNEHRSVVEEGGHDLGDHRGVVNELGRDHVRTNGVVVRIEDDAGVVDVAVGDVVDVAAGADRVEPAAVAGDRGRDRGVEVDVGKGGRSDGLLFGLLLLLFLRGLLLGLGLLGLLLGLLLLLLLHGLLLRLLLLHGLLLLLLLHGLLLLLVLLLDLHCGLLLGVVIVVAATDERQTCGADAGASAGAEQGSSGQVLAGHSGPVVSLGHVGLQPVSQRVVCSLQ